MTVSTAAGIACGMRESPRTTDPLVGIDARNALDAQRDAQAWKPRPGNQHRQRRRCAADLFRKLIEGELP